METIVIEIAPDSRSHREYQSFTPAAAVTVGRSFDNDVILSDPYVSARHVTVERSGAGFRIRDLDSANGTRVNGALCPDAGMEAGSGAEIVIGKTRLRVYLGTHPVPAARALEENSRFYRMAGNPVVAWGLAITVVGLSLLDAHWSTTKNENLLKLLPAAIGMLSSVLVWSGFWAFIGRLLRHRTCFLEHVSVCGLWFLSGGLLDHGVQYFAFYAGRKWLGLVLGYALNSGLLVAALFATLTFSANMAFRKKMIFSGVFTGLLMLSLAGLRLSAAEYYAWGPPYDSVLKPPVFGARPGRPVPDFVSRTGRLFEFKARDKGTTGIPKLFQHERG